MSFFKKIRRAHKIAKRKTGSSTKGLKRRKDRPKLPKPEFSKTKIIRGKRYKIDRKFKKNEEPKANKRLAFLRTTPSKRAASNWSNVKQKNKTGIATYRRHRDEVLR